MFRATHLTQIRYRARLICCQTETGNIARTINVKNERRCHTLYGTSLQLKPGDKVHGYSVNKITEIPEFALAAVQLTHEATGANHLHINREDSNNVFGIGFRTTPMDSTGVPHILEHTVLCGSHKYPVRDPFFKMLNRSLSTFMNAFTASDWTMYPFSTQNRQDYENLMSVYLDAVFHPRLSQLDFHQEGWRLEHANPSDRTTPLMFKGVVFNEMKGVFSNSQAYFAQRNQNLLLPAHTYGNVSGGEPLCIPDLTWQQLRKFHASHYHPSNALFYTYGNLDLERHLQLINEVLSGFSKAHMNTRIPCEPRWLKEREAEIDCGPDPLSADQKKQTTVAVSYVLTDVADTFENFVLSVLGYLMTAGEKAPFYRSLIEANIGSDYAPSLGYSGNTKDSTFTVGLQGIHADDANKVKNIIQNTFKDMVREGFEKERIDGVLHMIELGQKHQTVQFGLKLGIAAVSINNSEGDPIEAIQISKCVKKFQEKLEENPNYLQEMIQHYFLDNTHRLTLTMSPKENFEANLQTLEEEKLNKFVSNLTSGQKDLIYKEGLELAETQNTEEDLSCLPTLLVSDIELTQTPVTTESLSLGSSQVLLCEQPTNGVTYFRALSNISTLPDELLPYLPLFATVVTKMGAGELDFRELSQQIELKTGGLSSHVHITDHHTEENTYEQGLLFSSYCLDKNTEDMFNLWAKIFNSLDLSDQGHLMTLIQMNAAGLANSIADSGHTYAMAAAASSLSPASRLSETMSGMTQVNLMKGVAEMQDVSTILQKLQQIGSHILNKNNIRFSLNASPEALDDATRILEDFTQQLQQTSQHHSFYNAVPDFNVTRGEHVQYELPFQVNYISNCMKTVPFTHPDFPRLRILSRIMTSKFLHREIREKGGAYSGGVTGASPGIYKFYSYRDPNSVKTIEAFDRSISWASDGSFSDQDIDEAKLSVFSQVDAPVTPGDKGQKLFLHGINEDTLQAHREALFDVSRSDLLTVTNRYLMPSSRVSCIALLGPENQICQEEQWNIHRQ